MAKNSWQRKELAFIVVYAICFYAYIIYRSLKLSRDYYGKVWGLRPGWIADRLNDVSDGQWRNFRGNLPILTAVFGAFTLVAMALRKIYHLRVSGMSIVWLVISLIYLIYLDGACVLFILSIATLNFVIVKGDSVCMSLSPKVRFVLAPYYCLVPLAFHSREVLNFMWLKFLLIWRYSLVNLTAN